MEGKVPKPEAVVSLTAYCGVPRGLSQATVPQKRCFVLRHTRDGTRLGTPV
jgi:hypothetical protein